MTMKQPCARIVCLEGKNHVSPLWPGGSIASGRVLEVEGRVLGIVSVSDPEEKEVVAVQMHGV